MNTKPLTVEEIEELRKMEAKATPGEWILETVKTQVGICHKIGKFPHRRVGNENYACLYDDFGGAGETSDELLANAQLYVAMRNALPRLLSMLPSPQPAQPGEVVRAVYDYPALENERDALRARCEALREALRDIREYWHMAGGALSECSPIYKIAEAALAAKEGE